MLEIGSVVDGKYKILNKIGQGGMSVVYLAMNERANKQWAIKEVRKDGKQDFEVVKQGLIAETDLLKKLNHPHLPSIIDVIDGDGTFLIVMDYIEGKPLSKMLDEYGAQPQEYVIEWAKQLCNVLGYLHSRQPAIIYRDMKPSNVMLKPDGDVTLIDFGTAREFKSDRVEDTSCLGTRGYAAPEQYGGRGQTDARTDIYCLGATIYHLLTGLAPLAAPYYGMVPIRQINPALSAGLEEIIIKCTQDNPADRYQNCSELLYALEHYDELDDEYRGSQRKKMRMFSVTVGLTLMFGVGALLAGVKENSLTDQNYTAYLSKAQTSLSFNDKTENYTQAIRLNPKEKEGYLTMLSDYVDNDEEFSIEDSAAVTTAFYSKDKKNASGIDYLEKADPEGYAEVCFQLGIDYFFKYKGTEGKKSSVDWFNKVVNLGEKGIDEVRRNRAEIYSRIGTYYQSLGKVDKSGESTNANYNSFFGDLALLNNSEVVALGNNTTAFTLYNEIAVQISDHAQDFLSNGVTRDKIMSELTKIEGRYSQLQSSEESLNNLKRNVEKAKSDVEIAYGRLTQKTGVSTQETEVTTE